MSRKPMPDMDALYDLKSKKPTHKNSTKTTQKPTEKSTYATLKRYDIRFNPDDWEALKQHFSGQGLTVSAGIRMVVKKYMQQESV